MSSDHTEKAFPKQHQIRIGKNVKRALGTKVVDSKKRVRFFKNIGLGFKTPKEAIDGTYIDHKCPFTSDVSIRGRVLKGTVLSVKMKKTIVIRRNYLHFIKKYSRYEKRHKNVSVHCSPAFRVKEGDLVTVGECRPLSKTVRFNVIAVESRQGPKKNFRSF